MDNSAPIRVLVVDDSAFMRKAISGMFAAEAGFEVVGIARDGLDAVHQAREKKPDVVTLDVEMPKLDGLSALPRIRQVCDAAVIMVSSLTTEGSEAALTALRLGASDMVAKDASQISLSIGNLQQELLGKVRAIAGNHNSAAPKPSARPASAVNKLAFSKFDVLVIGSSTGGPPVLETLLNPLPATFPLPIVVAQHMPLIFTKAMAARLDGASGLHVLHGERGLPLLPGHAFIAPGGQHARIQRGLNGRLRLDVSDQPAESLYKPSVNELFRSAAAVCKGRTLAIVLTGMGEDGLEGARLLHPAGATILAQDPESCVVYGMPKAVTQAGLIAASLCPDQMLKLLTGSTLNAGSPLAAANAGS